MCRKKAVEIIALMAFFGIYKAQMLIHKMAGGVLSVHVLYCVYTVIRGDYVEKNSLIPSVASCNKTHYMY